MYGKPPSKEIGRSFLIRAIAFAFKNGITADFKPPTHRLAAVTLPANVTGNAFTSDNEMTTFNGTSLSYDSSGNLTGDGTNTYSWDARKHLSGIGGGASASFVYDAFGRRMSKAINGSATQFLYDGLRFKTVRPAQIS
jgi:hypothetical protein